MSADVLKSFLVSLGFKVEGDSERKFKDAVRSATLQAELLARALENMAREAAKSLTGIVESFDRLYYTSQRTGASVQNIRGLSFAFSQVGGTSGQAVAAIESFARAMRTNPGTGAFVRSLGVATTAGGKARDSMEVLLDAVGTLQRKHPYFVGAQMAEILGIDEDTFNLLSRQGAAIKAYRAEYERTSKLVGLNNREASDATHRFSQALGSLGVIARTIGERMLVTFVPVLERVVNTILNWIRSHPETVEKFFKVLGEAAEWVATKLEKFIESGGSAFGDKMNEWIESVTKEGGFIWMLEKIASGFEKIYKFIRQVIWGYEVLERWTKRFTGMEGGHPAIGTRESDWTGGMPNLDGPATGRGALAPYKRGPFGRLKDWVTGGRPSIRRGYKAGGGGQAGAATIGNWWTTERQQHAIDRLTAGGVSELGAKALVARWSSVEARGGPASVNPNSGAFGIAQWLGSRKPGINGNTSFDDQIDYAIKELKSTEGRALRTLNSARTAREAADGAAQFERAEGWNGQTDNFARQTEAAMAKIGRDAVRGAQGGQRGAAPASSSDSEAQKKAHENFRGWPGWKRSGVPGLDASPLGPTPALGSTSNDNSSRSVVQHNSTTIKIDGSGDPATTGSHVERGLNRANELQLRNAQTAVR